MTTEHVHPDVEELVALIGPDLRAARDASPLPVLGADLAAVFADGLPAVAAPAPGRRRILRRVAVGATVLGLSTGGLGVAGALPGPVQRAVADVADVVGVRIPESDEGPRVTPILPEPTTSTAPSSSSTTAAPLRPSTTAPLVVDEEADDDDGSSRGRGRSRGRDDVDETDDTTPEVETDARSGPPATAVPKSKDDEAERDEAEPEDEDEDADDAIDLEDVEDELDDADDLRVERARGGNGRGVGAKGVDEISTQQ